MKNLDNSIQNLTNSGLEQVSYNKGVLFTTVFVLKVSLIYLMIYSICRLAIVEKDLDGGKDKNGFPDKG